MLTPAVRELPSRRAAIAAAGSVSASSRLLSALRSLDDGPARRSLPLPATGHPSLRDAVSNGEPARPAVSLL